MALPRLLRPSRSWSLKNSVMVMYMNISDALISRYCGISRRMLRVLDVSTPTPPVARISLCCSTTPDMIMAAVEMTSLVPILWSSIGSCDTLVMTLTMQNR